MKTHSSDMKTRIGDRGNAILQNSRNFSVHGLNSRWERTARPREVRLAALRRYAILDTPSEETFDRGERTLLKYEKGTLRPTTKRSRKLIVAFLDTRTSRFGTPERTWTPGR